MEESVKNVIDAVINIGEVILDLHPELSAEKGALLAQAMEKLEKCKVANSTGSLKNLHKVVKADRPGIFH